jgi:hypothetical protein
MKYFTLAWWQGNQDLQPPFEDKMRPLNDYKQFYASVKDQLPPLFAEFQETHSLHDATFLGLNVDVEKQEARLALLLSIRDTKRWEEKEGWLFYTGLHHFGSSQDAQHSLGGPSGHGDLGYDEAEVIGAGLFEHRMLFSSGVEFTVRFENFRYEVK